MSLSILLYLPNFFFIHSAPVVGVGGSAVLSAIYFNVASVLATVWLKYIFIFIDPDTVEVSSSV